MMTRRHPAADYHCQGGFVMKHTKTLAIACAAGLASLCSVPYAEELPKSGTISIHTGWKVVGENINVADKIMQGHGNVVGVSFNDKGSGPLHGGPAICF